jgi:hypothetical protein
MSSSTKKTIVNNPSKDHDSSARFDVPEHADLAKSFRDNGLPNAARLLDKVIKNPIN